MNELTKLIKEICKEDGINFEEFKEKMLKENQNNYSNKFSFSEVINGNSNYLISQLRKDYPNLSKIIEQNPPLTLLGEHLVLKHYFNIYNIIKPEAIRINKTDYRCGKISTRWALYIYADSVNKFIKEINFISKRKRKITHEMSKIKGYKRQYFALEIMKKIQKNKIIKTLDFVREMKIHGYISPRTYLWRYEKKGIIKRIKKGKYKLLVN